MVVIIITIAIIIILIIIIIIIMNSQDPNMRGQDCQSMGKLESIIGHFALIVRRML